MKAIVVENLKKEYRTYTQNVPALRDVSFSVAEGEVFGFVGPNGAGKSTTIKIILDIISDYQGTVEIFGCNSRKYESRRALGYVPEIANLPDQLTPLETLQIGIKLLGVRVDNPDKHCIELLEKFGVAEYANRRLRTLSKGNVQRTVLAHAMLGNPKLLILDEPLSGLDPIGRRDVVEQLEQYKYEGGSIFFTSHVLHDVERIADRFGLIHKGELKTIEPPSHLLHGNNSTMVVSISCDRPVNGFELKHSNMYEREVAQKELWDVLAEVEKYGGLIIEVRPTLTLEKVFMRLVDNNEKY